MTRVRACFVVAVVVDVEVVDVDEVVAALDFFKVLLSAAAAAAALDFFKVLSAAAATAAPDFFKVLLSAAAATAALDFFKVLSLFADFLTLPLALFSLVFVAKHSSQTRTACPSA